MDSTYLSQALHAREIAAAYFIFHPRVALIDVGWRYTGGVKTDELAVRFHVHDKPDAPGLESLNLRSPKLVIRPEGIVPFQVDFIQASYPLHWGWRKPVEPRAGAFDPLKGGVSISSERLFGYGTLGGIVEDCDTADLYILSNWHVLAGSLYVTPGLRIFQPGMGDGGRLSQTVAALERHAFNRGIDAAVARLNASRAWVNDQFEIGAVTGETSPRLGMRVTKSGRASRITSGVIDGIEGEYPIYYEGFQRRIKHILNIRPAPGEDDVSTAGDSGSWWLEEETHKAVGLHFAGQNNPDIALAMDMPAVLAALNVRIAGLPHA